MNVSNKWINFFIFRLLDKSANGFLTVSDLFRFMQKFTDNPRVEKEIFWIK